jgi:ribose 5-phosphate isomerase B
MPTVILGSDHAALILKAAIKKRLDERSIAWIDVGTDCETSCDYPKYAHDLCKMVLETPDALGVLCCGTGLGMSMAANRHQGVRAALCYNEFTARMAREHNNANVLCMGERVLGLGLALATLDAFLDTPFAGGRHERRVNMIELPGDLH